jgi:hypothetical protein
MLGLLHAARKLQIELLNERKSLRAQLSTHLVFKNGVFVLNWCSIAKVQEGPS